MTSYFARIQFAVFKSLIDKIKWKNLAVLLALFKTKPSNSSKVSRIYEMKKLHT